MFTKLSKLFKMKNEITLMLNFWILFYNNKIPPPSTNLGQSSSNINHVFSNHHWTVVKLGLKNPPQRFYLRCILPSSPLLLFFYTWFFVVSHRRITQKNDEEKENERAKPTNKQVDDKQEIVSKTFTIWMKIIKIDLFVPNIIKLCMWGGECFTEQQSRYFFLNNSIGNKT